MKQLEMVECKRSSSSQSKWLMKREERERGEHREQRWTGDEKPRTRTKVINSRAIWLLIGFGAPSEQRGSSL